MVAGCHRVAGIEKELEAGHDVEVCLRAVPQQRSGIGDELHHEVGQPLEPKPVFASGEDLCDVGVYQPAENLDFLAEAIGKHGRAGVPHELHGDWPGGQRLLTSVDAAHAPFGDHRLNDHIADARAEQGIIIAGCDRVGFTAVVGAGGEAEVRRMGRQPCRAREQLGVRRGSGSLCTCPVGLMRLRFW